MTAAETRHEPEGVAIIGMSGRFPGAKHLREFWHNLCDGVESIVFFSDQELQEAGVPVDVLSDPNYVKAAARLADVEWFDAGFFGYSAKEATIMDPQHRLFLECAWEALEEAGYAPDTYDGSIAVYAGAGANSYLSAYSHRLGTLEGDVLATFLANAADFLTTRVSYKLNLRGPSLTVQTACSTSLVAVHLACQSLLHGECDMALAGGVSIKVTDIPGYFYQQGGIASPDGHCRAFDAGAQGTLFGDGVGIVVLKRVEEAIADGDHIYAVIRGSAINNDGASKVGYTAPSVSGQARVISEALAIAGMEPATIGHVETHGTGTALGDPVEIAALSRAFRAGTDRKGFCAISSVKTNIGHLDAAAGIASLIKTALMLHYEKMPPSLHFERPNPEIDFANSPFVVNTTLRDWKTGGTPRRAGVSSFGMGGTNVHLVLEEASPRQASRASVDRPLHVLALSAKTESALLAMAARYTQYFDAHPDAVLGDVCFTTNVGRVHFPHRLAIVASSVADARAKLAETVAGRQTPEVFRRNSSPLLSNAMEIDAVETLAEQYVNGADVDWLAFDRDYARSRVSLPSYPFERRRYWLEADVAAVPQHSNVRQQLEETSVSMRMDRLQTYLETEVQAVLGIDSTGSIDPHRGFFDMGMESLTALELKSRLEKGLGCMLPSTFSMNYPNVEMLAGYLASQVMGWETAARPEPVADAAEPMTKEIASLSEDELAALLDNEVDQILGKGNE